MGEEDLVFGEENLEYKNNGCEATDDDQMEKNDDERSGGIETPVIPMELLDEVDTLNNMKDRDVEKWKSPKEMMRAFQEKKKQYWAIQDKANDIIDSTRARANFDQQANKEPVAPDDDSDCDGIEPDDGEGSTNEEEEELVFGEENLEYKNNGCEATDDDQMEQIDAER